MGTLIGASIFQLDILKLKQSNFATVPDVSLCRTCSHDTEWKGRKSDGPMVRWSEKDKTLIIKT